MIRTGARGLVHLAAAAVALPLYALLVAPVARVSAAVRRRRGKPAILWGPQPILNNRYSALADRLYGYRSETLVYDVYRINARRDFDHVWARAFKVPLAGAAVPYAAFLWAGLRYDINEHVLIKIEGHYIDGTYQTFNTVRIPNPAATKKNQTTVFAVKTTLSF